MIRLTLRRLAYDDDGTPGILFVNGAFYCFTLERPWAQNRRNVSCIPEGTYPVEFRRSGSFALPPDHGGPERLYVRRVPGRSRILIHWGNKIVHTKGCILAGRGLRGTPSHDRYFLSRTKVTVLALEELLNELGPDPMEIEVMGPRLIWESHSLAD